MEKLRSGFIEKVTIIYLLILVTFILFKAFQISTIVIEENTHSFVIWNNLIFIFFLLVCLVLFTIIIININKNAHEKWKMEFENQNKQKKEQQEKEQFDRLAKNRQFLDNYNKSIKLLELFISKNDSGNIWPSKFQKESLENFIIFIKDHINILKENTE